jgi:hypothetical protein
MADQIIFQIDAAPTLKALNDISDSLTNLRGKLKEAKDAGQENTDGYKLLSAEIKGLEKEQRGLTTALTNQVQGIKTLEQTTKGLIDAKNFENNSIIENRKLYNALYNQLLNMKNPSQALIQQTKQLSETLKAQESALGNNTRNVANYKESILSALGGIKGFSQGTEAIAKGLDSAKLGFQAAGGGVKGFSAALATTGLPIVIMAVNQLIDVFKNFKPVSDAVESSVTALKNAFGALISGGSMSEAVRVGNELLETMRDLEDTQNAYNLQLERNQGEIESLLIASKDRTKTEQERLGLIKQAQKLEAESFNASAKRLNEELRAEEASLLEKTKLSKKELLILATTADANDENLKRIRAKAENETRLDEEQLKKYQGLLLRRQQLINSSNKFEEKAVNANNKLIEKEEAEREKAQAKAEAAAEKERKREEDKRKRIDDFAKFELDTIAKNRQAIESLEQQFILNERQRIEKSYAEKLVQVKGNGERENNLRIAIRQAQDKALADYDAKQNKSKIDKEQEQINALIQIDKQRYDNAIAQAELEIKDQQELARRKLEIQLQYFNRQLEFAKQLALADGELTESELANIEKIKLAIQGVQEQIANPPQGKVTFGRALGVDPESIEEISEELSNIASITQSVSGLVNTIYEGRRAEIESTKNAEIAAIEQSTMSEEQKKAKIGEVEKRAAMQTYEIQKRQFEVNKAISIVQAVIAGAQAVIAQLANPTPYVGFILSALAAATTAAQIAVISAQKPPAPPKFKDGVIGLQGAGTETSDSISAQLSRGESVITAKATRAFAPQLAQMELAVGNRPNFQLGNRRFAGGYIPMGDGGFSSRYLGRGVEQTQMTEKAMTDAVAKMPAPILQYEEFSRFENSRDKSIGISEL